MNPARYEELLACLFDGELTPADAAELARAVDADDALRQDLRRQLTVWELWSQQEAPGRSSEAFIQGWQTRLHAEMQSADVFPRAVRARLERRQPRRRLVEILRLLETLLRPAALAWAGSLLVVAAIAVLWFATPRSAYAITTIKGEAVCTACVLHESHEHAPVIRVISGSATNLYYLVRNRAVAGLQDYFCSGPAAITAQGTLKTGTGRREFEAETVSLPATHTAPESTNAVRIIFPI